MQNSSSRKASPLVLCWCQHPGGWLACHPAQNHSMLELRASLLLSWEGLPCVSSCQEDFSSWGTPGGSRVAERKAVSQLVVAQDDQCAWLLPGWRFSPSKLVQAGNKDAGGVGPRLSLQCSSHHSSYDQCSSEELAEQFP